MKKQINIRLPEEVDERLQMLAETTGRTKTFYAEQAILKFIGEMESHYQAETEHISYTSTRSKGTGRHSGEQTA